MTALAQHSYMFNRAGCPIFRLDLGSTLGYPVQFFCKANLNAFDFEIIETNLTVKSPCFEASTLSELPLNEI